MYGIVSPFSIILSKNMLIAVKIILYVIIVIFLLLISVLVAAAITGRTNRAYSVLPPDEVLKIAGKKFTLSQLANRYKPKMYLRSTTPSPKLMWIWYEAVPRGLTIDFVYYFSWENEINPDTTIHRFYTVFRAAYYGYPLYDIEYFQVSVDKETGAVIELRFETSYNDDFFQNLPEHIIAQYSLNSDDTYSEILTTTDGKEVRRNPSLKVLFDGNRAIAGVQTWNHLSRILESHSSEYVVLQDAVLRFLYDKDYKRYKFARKSQGDHRTNENQLTMPIAVLSVFLFVYLPTFLIQRLTHSKK